jgi:16S rRNA (adenine1518-N6/adenine1519-N6)-dimethyltransferase
MKGSVLERIAAAACPDGEDIVIEIGPGRGALTQKLLPRATHLVAIEIDSVLVEHLHRKFGREEHLEIVHANVLATDLDYWGPAAIAGNLPYYITSPIVEKVIRTNFRRAVLLMQKEVAQRITARPGARDYGFLTVQTAVFANARQLFDVKPSAFHPPPSVDSAVVLFEPRRPIALGDPDGFLEFVGRCFHHKRKTIRNNLAEFYGNERIGGWPELGLRAEQLSLERFVEMYRRLG